jgi:hypothetical protein
MTLECFGNEAQEVFTSDDPCWFGDGLIRSLAAALAKISAPA